MPQSIVSIANQTIQYIADDDATCKCGERENCILVSANQQIYSQLQILPCGDFAVCNNSLGAELVCNGGFDLGDELVTNGTFTGSATGWTLGTNWAYETNDVRATAAAAGQTLSQTIASLVVSSYYYVSFTISSYVSGDVRVTLGGTNGTTRSANGTYTELIQVAAGTTLSFERVTTNFSGDIDDVSVKLVDCWDFHGCFSWSNGTVCHDPSIAAVISLSETISAGLDDGDYYLVSYTVSGRTDGKTRPVLGGTNGTLIGANGTFTEIIIAGAINEDIGFVCTKNGSGDGGFDGCIDDVSVKKITTCWDADETDWTTSSTGACHETGNTTDLTNTGTAVVSGKYYHITITVSESTAGGINIVLGTTVLAPQTSGNGTFHFWGTSNGTALIVRPTTDFDGCISALTADEYCTDYEFHLIPATGDEYVVVDMAAYYTLEEDIYNLTDFNLSDILITDGTHVGTVPLPYGCYRLCLVDCCSEQQTASSLLRNGDFALGTQYWTLQNVSVAGGVATFFSDFELNFIEQALITTHDADCIEIEFTFANEAIFGQPINIYIDGVLVDTEVLGPGAGAYTNTFSNISAGAFIRFQTGGLAADLIIDNIVVTVPENCQPIYDQCTPCINYQASFQCTKLVEGYCDGNALGFEFDDSGGNNQFKLSLRAKCELLHPSYEQEQEDYDSTDGNTSLSFGQSKKLQSLTFFPLPEFKHDVIALEKICDTFQIDGVDYFVKKGDYTPEWNKNSSTDLAPSRIDVKKKDQTLFNTNCE